MVAVVLTLTLGLVPTSAQPVVTATSSDTVALSEVLKKHVPKDVPILTDINITPPDPNIPQELIGLSGAWVGEYRGQRTNAHMADQFYVFEKISLTSVTVVSGGIGRFAGRSDSNYGKTWSSRHELQPTETSPLTIILPNGNKVTFLLKGGQLYAQSPTWVGTFKKIQ